MQEEINLKGEQPRNRHTPTQIPDLRQMRHNRVQERTFSTNGTRANDGEMKWTSTSYLKQKITQDKRNT